MTLPDVDNSNTPLADAVDHIEGEGVVWVRGAAIQVEEEWQARNVELITGAEPPAWQELVWDYPEVRFFALRVSGSEAAVWLRTGKMVLGSRFVTMPELNPQVHWTWSASLRPYGFSALEWPSWTTQLDRNTQRNEPRSPLVSDTAPTFATFYDAAVYVFCGGKGPPGGQLLANVVYRHQDTSGRIETVRYGKEVEVAVRGSALDGMTVELAGRMPGPAKRVWNRHNSQGRETVTFTLTEAVEHGTWVALRQGGKLVDRRTLAVQHGYGDTAGVEEVVEIGSRLESFLAQREGPTLEFKSEMPREDGSKKNVMKSVTAFANGVGGSIVFGIDDDYNVLGLPKAKTAELADTLTRIIDTWVEPTPPYEIRVLPIEDEPDKEVIELVVGQGTRLYCCGKQTRNRLAYVRTQGLSVPARPEEMEEIMQSRSQASPTSPFWHGL